MAFIDFNSIVQEAWMAYDPSRPIKNIVDISAMVSTNHVYKVLLKNGQFVIGKLSYFGQYQHFVEDNMIINVLSNNLPYPYENFLSRALMDKDGLFVYRHESEVIDAWVVFYRPVPTKGKLPRRLKKEQIEKLAAQFAHFHQACHSVRHTLPPSSKVLYSDIDHLLRTLNSQLGKVQFGPHESIIRHHCTLFKTNMQKLNAEEMNKIPVFVDWNIGNFSVDANFQFYTRWDYDWFRVSSRMMDFYFISRIVSDIGDRTIFSYLADPLSEDRFLFFLKKYHEIYPFHPSEIRLLKEVYRFFILIYVIHFGTYFFHDQFAKRLLKEAFATYLPSIDRFDPSKLLHALKI